MKKLNQRGQGMTEYILIVALIAIAVIGAVKYFGHSTQDSFHSAADAVGSSVQKGINEGTH